MAEEFIAHKSEKEKDQTVFEHLKNVAELSRDFSIDEFKNVNYLLGILHDIGKYSNEFQKHIRGSKNRVEHSICGAKEVPTFCTKDRSLKLLLQLCIAGHHTGLPDCGTKADESNSSSLQGRLKRDTVDYSYYKNETNPNLIDNDDFMRYLIKDCKTKEDLVEKFSFLVRYCFSCLVDADSLDTRNAVGENVTEKLKCDFSLCNEDIDAVLNRFIPKNTLQEARNNLQKQALSKIDSDADIYLMNMPTGSGKTLASMQCALKRIKKSNGKLKRIIYVIPYNSIIDQTVEVFESIFNGHTDILRHQSSFVYDEKEQFTEDYVLMAKYASENWDAGIIVTTAVQFFESLYGNKRNKLRKVHNLADSVIIFDEAHLMPREYLDPCLRGVTFIAKYLHSEVMLLTATMPDFRSIIERYNLNDIRITDLISDVSEFKYFKKCNYSSIGTVSDMDLAISSSKYASSLIVTNTRKGAADIYKLCSGEKYHLSTYMTAFDREKTISRIKESLAKLYVDYPDLTKVPQERRITVVSTSLIEAGVDMDFVTVYRELAGLDNILQAGGRCNREGLRKNGNVFVFEREDNKVVRSEQEFARGIIDEFDDISEPKAIRSYYERLFSFDKVKFNMHSISNGCESVNSIPFSTYSENFRIIDDRTVSVAVCRDEISKQMYEKLCTTGYINSRRIQKYCCTVYLNEFDLLLKQKILEDYGSGVFFLTDDSYYDENLGIRFEGKDYIID